MFTWWNSSSIVDRRTRFSKAYVVQTVEKATVNEAEAKCSEAAQAIEATMDDVKVSMGAHPLV
jgi:hypothetical protein